MRQYKRGIIEASTLKGGFKSKHFKHLTNAPPVFEVQIDYYSYCAMKSNK